MDKTDYYKKLLEKFLSLEAKLQDPTVISNTNLLREISTEHARILPIADKLKELIKLYKQLSEVTELKKTEANKEMLILYSEEFEEITSQITSLEKEIKKIEKTTDPDDKRNAILEIRAGTGGEEAALFAADLFRMYSQYGEKMHWKILILSAHYSSNNGFKEIIFRVEGNGSYGKLKFESGVHRVQRIPITESSGRIHTSATSVVVLPEVDDIPDIIIKDNEIKIDVYRSTGPGGQSVNTTDSAVRITHIPTGIVVTCQDSKSQHKNKDRALSVLKSKLYQIQQQNLNEKTDSTRKQAIKSGDRSAKIRTYNFPQNRVTDHRIKQSWHNLTSILNGEIDELITETREKLSDENDV